MRSPFADVGIYDQRVEATSVYYEVWHEQPSLDRAGGFETQQLASLRQTLVERGPDFVRQFSLVRVDSLNRRTTVAEGPALLALVERAGTPLAGTERSRRKRAAA